MAFFKLTLFFVLGTAPIFSYSWGPTGHRIVGEIAQRQLSGNSLRAVNMLLDQASLARVSNWPDEIKSDPENYKHTFSWHYMTWPNGQDEYDYHGEGELIQAIQTSFEKLKDKKKPKPERAIALKFLIHLIGDLHQPLHVGNGQDMGGNTCQIIFHGQRVNLHALWDEKLIAKTDLSFTEYTNFLLQKNMEIKLDISMKEVISWAAESRELREKIYPDEVDMPKQKESNILSKDYCRRDIDHLDAHLPKIGYKYSYAFKSKMEQRLLLAGLRLGAIINQALN